MSDLPPQLGDIPHTSDFQVPTLNTTNGAATGPTVSTANGSTTADNAKSTLASARDTVTASESHTSTTADLAEFSPLGASQAANTIANHPVTQNVKETINNGLPVLFPAPVTAVAKDQAAKTSAEFDNLKNSRRTPSTTLANDQPLTHYHSFFYTLLSWENPRVTSIAFAASVIGIFAFRYVPALRLLFKSLYLVLGTVALVEAVTKLIFGAGVAQSMRPKRYLTIPRETLEASLEDVEQLINFFVIEFQRILYAENVLHTTLAFVASFISYYLIKFVPTWGLLLIGTSLIFTVPLIYVTNQEAIDHYLASANEVVSAQAKQVQDIASQHTSQAVETVKAYAGDYSAKAQELVGAKRSPSPQATFKSQDFPVAPKKEPVAGTSAARPIPA